MDFPDTHSYQYRACLPSVIKQNIEFSGKSRHTPLPISCEIFYVTSIRGRGPEVVHYHNRFRGKGLEARYRDVINYFKANDLHAQ